MHELPENVDLVFICAFTESAQTAYAMSALFRSRGAVTVLGGPHARCYPQDAVKYFDYVVGFTDKKVIRDILLDCSPHRPEGLRLAARQQPLELPSVRERWQFIEPTLRKAPLIKMVPMLGSLGCPYTCSFCIDSVVPYQALDFDVMKKDLAFLLGKFKRPLGGTIRIPASGLTITWMRSRNRYLEIASLSSQKAASPFSRSRISKG
jgi:hypothetical protein